MTIDGLIADDSIVEMMVARVIHSDVIAIIAGAISGTGPPIRIPAPCLTMTSYPLTRNQIGRVKDLAARHPGRLDIGGTSLVYLASVNEYSFTAAVTLAQAAACTDAYALTWPIITRRPDRYAHTGTTGIINVHD